MKNKLTVSAVLFLMSFIATAQDIIFKTDRTEVKSKILEIEESVVKYKKFEFLDGPTYTMSKSEIYMIIYKNGQKEIFENEKPVIAKNITENKASNNVVTPKTNATQSKTASEFTIEKLSFGVADLGVSLNNFSAYTIPNVSYNEDFLIRDNIALSYYASLNFIGTEYTFEGISITSSSFNGFIGLGGKYYFNEVLKLDPAKFHVYGGATIGYSTTIFSIESNSDLIPSSSGSANDIGYFAQIGGRYFFHKSLGVKTELQFGKGDTALMVGLSYKWIPKNK